jgi:uncharacterized OsmC-like protein
MSVEVTAYWEGGYRCRVPVRDFEIVVDEPAEYGGTDAGPMPTEVFVTSLASCFTLAVAHAAKKRDIVLPDLAVTVNAEYQALRFSRLRVEVRSSHPREILESLLEPAIGYCYVTNTLRGAPEMDFVVGHGPVTPAPAPPPG